MNHIDSETELKQKFRNTQQNEGNFTFTTTISGDLEFPNYQITLSDGSSRDVFLDPEGHKFYLIPKKKRIEFDAVSQILQEQETEVQMHKVYLP